MVGWLVGQLGDILPGVSFSDDCDDYDENGGGASALFFCILCFRTLTAGPLQLIR